MLVSCFWKNTPPKKHPPESKRIITLREESNAEKSPAELKNSNLVQNSHSFIPHFSGILDHSPSFIPHFSVGSFAIFYSAFSKF